MPSCALTVSSDEADMPSCALTVSSDEVCARLRVVSCTTACSTTYLSEPCMPTRSRATFSSRRALSSFRSDSCELSDEISDSALLALCSSWALCLLESSRSAVSRAILAASSSLARLLDVSWSSSVLRHCFSSDIARHASL